MCWRHQRPILLYGDPQFIWSLPSTKETAEREKKICASARRTEPRLFEENAMLVAEQKIGPYTLVRRLGQGAYGAVWLVE